MNPDVMRVITEREIYDEEFGDKHKICLELATKEALEMSLKYQVPIECFDISALTFQKFKVWYDNSEKIARLKKEKQALLDRR